MRGTAGGGGLVRAGCRRTIREDDGRLDDAAGDGDAAVDQRAGIRGVTDIPACRHTVVLDDVRESPISRGPGLDLPVALTLGSDVLARFIVTIDLRAKKLVLAAAQ
jgi:hypothetical protein